MISLKRLSFGRNGMTQTGTTLVTKASASIQRAVPSIWRVFRYVTARLFSHEPDLRACAVGVQGPREFYDAVIDRTHAQPDIHHRD